MRTTRSINRSHRSIKGRSSSSRPAAATAARYGGRRPQRSSNRSVAKVSYVESDSDVDSDGEVRPKKVKREPISAMDEDTSLDDEVERVLGHRWVGATETERMLACAAYAIICTAHV